MAEFISTDTVAAPDQFDFWHHSISTTYVPLEARAAAGERSFRAALTANQVGSVHVILLMRWNTRCAEPLISSPHPAASR